MTIICRMGTHEISHIVGDRKTFECTCGPKGDPANRKLPEGDPNKYPCRALKRFFRSFKFDKKPPKEAVFTEEGADEAINDCDCLDEAGVQLVREQIRVTGDEPPEEPAEEAPPREGPSRKAFPCPACGRHLKYKQCCEPCECGSGKPTRECHGRERAEKVLGEGAPAPKPPKKKEPPPPPEPKKKAKPKRDELPPPPPPASPKQAKAQAKRRREVAKKEQKAATARRVDASLELAHKIDDKRKLADRAARKARALEQSAGKSRKREAVEARREAVQLREKAAKLRDQANRIKKRGAKVTR